MIDQFLPGCVSEITRRSRDKVAQCGQREFLSILFHHFRLQQHFHQLSNCCFVQRKCFRQLSHRFLPRVEHSEDSDFIGCPQRMPLGAPAFEAVKFLNGSVLKIAHKDRFVSDCQEME